eukprot:3371175-Rhodomonas_salina.2
MSAQQAGPLHHCPASFLSQPPHTSPLPALRSVCACGSVWGVAVCGCVAVCGVWLCGVCGVCGAAECVAWIGLRGCGMACGRRETRWSREREGARAPGRAALRQRTHPPPSSSSSPCSSSSPQPVPPAA